MAEGLYRTGVEISVQSDLGIDRLTSIYRNPWTSLSVTTALKARVYFCIIEVARSYDFNTRRLRDGSYGVSVCSFSRKTLPQLLYECFCQKYQRATVKDDAFAELHRFELRMFFRHVYWGKGGSDTVQSSHFVC